MTQHHAGSAPGHSHGRVAPDAAVRSSGHGLVSFAAGALGVVAAILPSMGIVALVLAAVAIGVGVPVMRRGPQAASFAFARVGVVLGMISVLIGVLSVAMQLLD